MSIRMLLGFVLLFSSFAGYVLLLKERYKILPEFAPVVICSGIGSALFFAGTLNIMPLAVLCIFLFGLFQLRYLKKFKVLCKNTRFIMEIVLFLMVCLYFAWLLKGTMFTHYDNFSHWALVVKDILSKDRLPNFQSELISFQSYPTGTACFIYYVCKILGETEGCMAFAQLLIIISSIFTLCAFLNKKNLYMLVGVLTGGIYFLVSNVQITELLVDTVLPLLGIASIAIVYYYRDNIIKAILLTAPVFLFLPCVKNSGIYFCLIGIVFIIYMALKSRCFKRVWKIIIVFSVATPLSSIYLWKQHVAYVFSQGEGSKHAMSVSNYKATLSEKTWNDIVGVSKSLAAQVFTFKNEGIMILLMLTVVLMVGCWVRISKEETFRNSVETKIAILCYGIYFLYILSLLAMYIFSMPLPEAQNLASFERYNQTIVAFIFGVLLLYVFIYIPSISRKNIVRSAAAIITLFILAYPAYRYRDYWCNLYSHDNKIQVYTKELRMRIEELRIKNDVPAEKKYVVYISDMPYSTGYGYYLTRYVMSSNNILVCNVNNFSEKADEISQYDYLFICKTDKIVTDILHQMGMESDKEVLSIEEK